MFSKNLCYVLLLLSLGLTSLATAQDEPEAGETRLDEFGISQVWVPAGCFMMGTSEEQSDFAISLEPPNWARRRLTSEQPAHEVCLSEGYWIDQYEVTHASFNAFIADGGYTTQDLWSETGWEWLSEQSVDELPPACGQDLSDDQPQVCITWYEAEAYAHWRGGSLPTEAQWEFAARSPESLIYPWGNEWDETRANVVESEELMPVGSFPEGVSWVNAHDMSGNAMEWVNDWLGSVYYGDSPKDDPTGPEDGRQKVEKGGWWGSNPFVSRSAYRHFEDPPDYQDHHIGVRVVSQ
jgi:formylglycine-generating enzyme required for sulfatase activity